MFGQRLCDIFARGHPARKVASVKSQALQANAFIASTLDAFAASGDSGERGLWFRVAIDYFLSADQGDPEGLRRVAGRMAEALSRAGDIERLEVAKQLSMALSAPSGLFDAIEAMGGEAGLYVLSHCAALGEGAVERALAGPDSARAAAAALRPDLSRAMIECLTRRADPESAVALASNQFIALAPQALEALARRALSAARDSGDGRLAQAILARRPVTDGHAALFALADAPTRAAILAAARRAALGRTAGAPESGAGPREIERLESFAMDWDERAFVAALAGALDCGADFAQMIADDAAGDLLAMAFSALGAREDSIVRILASRDLREPKARPRIAALARLRGALTPQASLRVLAAMRGASRPAPPRHAPQLDQTAAPLARAAAAISPAVARRRRAFAYASGRRFVGEPG